MVIEGDENVFIEREIAFILGYVPAALIRTLVMYLFGCSRLPSEFFCPFDPTLAIVFLFSGVDF